MSSLQCNGFVNFELCLRILYEILRFNKMDRMADFRLFICINKEE